jgi:hypothetical protein
MINVDLSKVLHPRVVDFLAAFLPGLFFESCLLLANPQSVALSRFCEDARRKIARLLLYGVRDGRTKSEVKQP